MSFVNNIVLTGAPTVEEALNGDVMVATTIASFKGSTNFCHSPQETVWFGQQGRFRGFYLDFPIKTALILDTKDQCKVISATHYVYSNHTIWNQDNYHHVGLWTQWIQLWAQILFITWPLMPLILIGSQYQLRLCVQHSLNCWVFLFPQCTVT